MDQGFCRSIIPLWRNSKYLFVWARMAIHGGRLGWSNRSYTVPWVSYLSERCFQQIKTDNLVSFSHLFSKVGGRKRFLSWMPSLHQSCIPSTHKRFGLCWITRIIICKHGYSSVSQLSMLLQLHWPCTRHVVPSGKLPHNLYEIPHGRTGISLQLVGVRL